MKVTEPDHVMEFENFDPYRGKIESVVIVGGGSSGWMTAAALAKLCPHLEVALVESKDIKTIGVGESTLGHFNQYLELLDLKDEDWMPHADATYKNGIQFTNFREGKEEVFQYPFYTDYDLTYAPHGLNTWAHLANMFPEDFPPESFAEFYCANTFLCNENKQTRNRDGVIRQFDFRRHTAYHLDATKFGLYLRDHICLPNGVQHMIGEITGFQTMYEKPNDQTISYLIMDGVNAIQADLFIDCTGFKSKLLGGFQGIPFIPAENKLANDKAWAARIPYLEETREKEMRNVTDCWAMPNGWTWDIPLWNRIGKGYVYSSRFVRKEKARQEFIEHLRHTVGKKRADEAKLFHIDIEHGRRQRAWVNNVVGIGLSYGFVEPLESTGLLTTHENILRLVTTLNQRNGYVTRTEKEGFNWICNYTLDNFIDFVAMHYAFSMRTDTPYWRWCTQQNFYNPESVTQNVPVHQSIEQFVSSTLGEGWHPNMNGIPFIAAGHGIKSSSYLRRTDYLLGELMSDKDHLVDKRKKYMQWKDYMEKYIAQLPTHYEFLRDEIYGTP